jgi:hypothetical protein
MQSKLIIIIIIIIIIITNKMIGDTLLTFAYIYKNTMSHYKVKWS